MSLFKLAMTETRGKIINIEADDIDDAVIKAYELFGEGLIELDRDYDLLDINIEENGELK